MKKEFTPRSVRLQGCNDLFYQVVTSLYRRIGNEKTTVYFLPIAFKYRILNNLLQDMKNFFGRIKKIAESTGYCNSSLKIEGFIFLIKGFQTFAT